MPLPLQQISTVDACRRDLDQHLVRPWLRGLDLPQFEHLRRTGLPCNDRFHAPQRAIGQGLELLAHRVGDPPTRRRSQTMKRVCLLLPQRTAARDFRRSQLRRGRLGSGRPSPRRRASKSGWARSHSGLVQAP